MKDTQFLDIDKKLIQNRGVSRGGGGHKIFQGWQKKKKKELIIIKFT